jgi:hypothetical protein
VPTNGWTQQSGRSLGCSPMSIIGAPTGPSPNDVGEPCAGEPHARFDRGPLAKRDTHGATDTTHPPRKRAGLSPSDLPATDQPAAYLTHRIRCAACSVVRELRRTAVAVVGLGQVVEAHGSDRGPVFEDRARDAMHTVHHTAIWSEDDRVLQIDVLYEPQVFDYSAHRGRLDLIEPISGVNLAQGGNVYVNDWKVAAQADESSDIPGVEAAPSRPEVVLLAHTRKFR